MSMLPLQRRYDAIVLEMDEVLPLFKGIYPEVLSHQHMLELYRQLFEGLEYNMNTYKGHLFTLPKQDLLYIPDAPPNFWAHLSRVMVLAGFAVWNMCLEHNHFFPDDADTFPYFLNTSLNRDINVVYLTAGYPKEHPPLSPPQGLF